MTEEIYKKFLEYRERVQREGRSDVKPRPHKKSSLEMILRTKKQAEFFIRNFEAVSKGIN